jgi:steroid 5-alpha reductase family enzyme
VNNLLSGVLIAFYAVIALSFLRFWITTRERLFAMFALAFTVLAAQRLALSLTNATMEDQTAFYLLRLAAFVIIVVAIVDKNRR